ncbi:MAG: hypothetical protein F2621_06455 [Actinobacteria bacterium]|uniref:Unannotated protein n=1 Tax=freshwater metagenome TaxID=449393 RepID=A0A6J6KTD0_9ZZZZ|nr:hypothetical protein [Actinomycetota bacterium]
MTIPIAIATYRKSLDIAKRRRRTFRHVLLSIRWNFALLKKRKRALPHGENFSDALSKISVSVINLKHRKDRYEAFSREMASLGITDWTRIEAVNGKARFPETDGFFAGSAGCTLSHIAALEEVDWSSCQGAMICEDDVEFLVPRADVEAAVAAFLESPAIDVLALSCRARGGSAAINNRLRLVVGVVGRGCYIVKPHMVRPLQEAFARGLPKLLAGDRRGKGDLMWQPLQSRRHFFATPRLPVAQQSTGFSDIEGRDLGAR